MDSVVFDPITHTPSFVSPQQSELDIKSSHFHPVGPLKEKSTVRNKGLAPFVRATCQWKFHNSGDNTIPFRI